MTKICTTTIMLVGSVLVFLWMGWAPDQVNLKDLGAPLKVEVYQNGKPEREFIIDPHAPQYKTLKNWFAANSSGWTVSYITYAPLVVITGEGFSLNIHKNRVILNVRIGKGNSKQYVKNSNLFFSLQLPKNTEDGAALK